MVTSINSKSNKIPAYIIINVLTQNYGNAFKFQNQKVLACILVGMFGIPVIILAKGVVPNISNLATDAS